MPDVAHESVGQRGEHGNLGDVRHRQQRQEVDVVRDQLSCEPTEFAFGVAEALQRSLTEERGHADAAHHVGDDVSDYPTDDEPDEEDQQRPEGPGR